MTGWWWRGGVLAVGLLGLPVAGRTQGWPLQTGPGGDAVMLSATALERLRPAVATSLPDPPPLSLPMSGAAPGWAAWALPSRPSRAAAEPRLRRAAAPRRPPPTMAEGASADRSLGAVKARLAEREPWPQAMQRDLAEDRRLVEDWRGARRATR